MNRFTPEMTVESALALHPKARWVFAAYHLRGCVDCTSAPEETLLQVAEGYRLPLPRLIEDLNSLMDA